MKKLKMQFLVATMIGVFRLPTTATTFVSGAFRLLQMTHDDVLGSQDTDDCAPDSRRRVSCTRHVIGSVGF
jgi:hypothetical protein